jgi:CubicO group peptidase (beta-lactamase class C family)
MPDAQAIMQHLIDVLITQNRERGVQLVAYLDGKKVVDVSAGIADPSTGRTVDGETLFPVFSCTKAVASTIMHRLVARGVFSYDTRLADVWPGFGKNGKNAIQLRHVLNHTSGLHLVPTTMTLADVTDWNRICQLLADAKPEWPAGIRESYHAVTHGWLLAEFARRVTGRHFAQLLVDEIVQPLKLSGMFIGLPPNEDARVAILDEEFEPGKEPGKKPDVVVGESIPYWIQPLHAWMNTAAGRRACVPASNGIMSARSLAKHYAALCPGGVDGVELLNEERVRIATQPQLPSEPQDNPARRGLGYALGGDAGDYGPRLSTFGHAGYGGANAFADPEKRYAVAFTKNFYSTRGATSQVLKTLRETLGVE